MKNPNVENEETPHVKNFKVFAGLFVITSGMVFSGFALYENSFDHINEACPLNDILGVEHQVSKINEENNNLTAIHNETITYYKKPYNISRSMNNNENIQNYELVKCQQFIPEEALEIYTISAGEDEIVIFNDSFEIVKVLKLDY